MTSFVKMQMLSHEDVLVRIKFILVYKYQSKLA